MKVLTLWNPWASLIAVGAKRIETRGWFTGYRGPLAIHAARKLPSTMRIDHYLQQRMREALEVSNLDALPLGAIVAVVDLVDCVPVEKLFDRVTQTPEAAFGNFADGRFGWVLEKVRPLREPLALAGRQGLWDLEGAAEAIVMERAA